MIRLISKTRVDKLSQDNNLHIEYGLTGNYYAFSKNKKDVEKVANRIGKSINSVYYNERHKVYAIRCKSKYHKDKLRSMKGDYNGTITENTSTYTGLYL